MVIPLDVLVICGHFALLGLAFVLWQRVPHRLGRGKKLVSLNEF